MLSTVYELIQGPSVLSSSSCPLPRIRHATAVFPASAAPPSPAPGSDSSVGPGAAPTRGPHELVVEGMVPHGAHAEAAGCPQVVKKKQRTRMLEFFIDVARECFNIGNFNSMMAIICECPAGLPTQLLSNPSAQSDPSCFSLQLA